MFGTRYLINNYWTLNLSRFSYWMFEKLLEQVPPTSRRPEQVCFPPDGRYSSPRPPSGQSRSSHPPGGQSRSVFPPDGRYSSPHPPGGQSRSSRPPGGQHSSSRPPGGQHSSSRPLGEVPSHWEKAPEISPEGCSCGCGHPGYFSKNISPHPEEQVDAAESAPSTSRAVFSGGEMSLSS